MPSRPTKSMLKKELLDSFEEVAPTQWTIPEIESRLQELKEANGMPTQRKKGRTPLRTMMIELNRASKKKSMLQDFLQNTLNVTVNPNHTMQQLQTQGTRHIYMLAEPSAEDPVGFGEHCSLQYKELLMNHGQYAQWVLTTDEEAESVDYRLHRLAIWLRQEKLKSMPMPKAKVAPTTKGFSTTSMKNSNDATNQEDVMQQMISLRDLKEDVDHLKAERPRKKVEAAANAELTDSSMSSFTPVCQ